MTIASQFVDYANGEPSTSSWEDIVGAWEDDNGQEATSVLAEIVDTNRWAVVHRQVFRFSDDSYADVHYHAPATEYQEQDPECAWVEVQPVPVTITQYQPITADRCPGPDTTPDVEQQPQSAPLHSAVYAEEERLAALAGKARQTEDLRDDPSPEAVADSLSLINIRVAVAEVKDWSRDMRRRAVDYALAVHLHASDNPDVTVPERPAFLPPGA